MIQAGAFIGLLFLAGGAQDDPALSPALKRFQEEYYRPGAKDDERISAVNALAQIKHERIVKVLAPLLCESSLAVRIMTARALGQFSGIEAAPRELQTALLSTANAGKKPAAVRIEILRSLGLLRYLPAAAEIYRAIDDKEVWVAKAAIDAAGRL